MLDLADPKNAHIDQRLRTEKIIWLSSVRPDGRPHLVPVWFLWDGSTVLIFSQPDKQKTRNLRHNPSVMLALDTASEGEDIVMLEGTAELLTESTAQVTPPAYVEKYSAMIKDMGWTAENMAQSYSQPIRITPTRFIGWAG